MEQPTVNAVGRSVAKDRRSERRRSDREMKRERTMEVGRRLTFGTAACQINGMSVQFACNLPRGNPRMQWEGGGKEAVLKVLSETGMNQQKRNHFITGAEKLSALPL